MISKGIDIDDPLVSRQKLISEIVNIEMDENLLKFDIKESQDLIIKLKRKTGCITSKKIGISQTGTNQRSNDEKLYGIYF